MVRQPKIVAVCLPLTLGMRMKRHLLLGTAGHIDHGKTSLVAALTGVDTDRLPDEKRRQITIDLGFAPLEIDGCTIGIVDVPGHERFIRNMLAGAAGIDLAMLVVAADDSVKPQTREHLDILRHMRLEAGLIVITKCDLAEPEWIELVEAEVRELTAGTFLADAPMIRVSSSTGEGIEQLRDAIATAARRLDRIADADGPFRMAIDRVFTVPGYGTVVTGSVASGEARVGDELQLQPQDILVRVRGLQSHDAVVEQVGRGQRAAINLSGVRYDEISRGQNLAKPGSLRPSQLVTVELTLSDQLVREVKHRSAIRLHVGTASVPGKIALLEGQTATAGTTTYAQVFLSRPVAVVWGQPFVVRSVSPVETLGGGRILDPLATRLKQLDNTHRQCFEDLATDDPPRRAVAAAWLAGGRRWQPADLSLLAGIDQPEIVLKQLLDDRVVRSYRLGNGETAYLHRDIVTQIVERLQTRLAAEHNNTPLRQLVERSRLAQHFSSISPPLFDALCHDLLRQKLIVVKKKGLALAGWVPQLSTSQKKMLHQIQVSYQAAQFHPPLLDQLAKQLGQSKEMVSELAEVAVEAGSLVRIAKGLFFEGQAEQQARAVVAANMEGGRELSVSQIRELLDTSRKVAVPFCEYLDTIGMTRRQGDMRRLVVSSTTATKT